MFRPIGTILEKETAEPSSFFRTGHDFRSSTWNVLTNNKDFREGLGASKMAIKGFLLHVGLK